MVLIYKNKSKLIMCCLIFNCNSLVFVLHFSYSKSFAFYVIIFLWNSMKNVLNLTFSCKTVEVKFKKSSWSKEVILISKSKNGCIINIYI